VAVGPMRIARSVVVTLTTATTGRPLACSIARA
jgi:hypothetical protein